ncbi:unnamed protein product [Laminaria digitata]
MAGRGVGDCGVWVGSLCDDPELGCTDSGGSYDITVPSAAQPGWYSVGVSRAGERGYVFDCSGEFEVVSSLRAIPS